MNARDAAFMRFSETHGGRPDFLVRAPGRVNLIGEHTDYNDGYVFPMAIEAATWIAARARPDRIVVLSSVEMGNTRIDLNALEPVPGHWSRYVSGVAWALGADALTGWEGAVATDVPVGGGLSSSAALEIGAALVFVTLAERPWDPLSAARSARRADNEWVGIASGIMDHLIVAVARRGHATLIDCRTLDLSHRPLPPDAAVVVLDTGTRRRLVDSAYDERMAACRQAAEASGVDSLRDLEPSDLPRVACLVDEVTFRRTRHVVTENVRTVDAAAALAAGDASNFGRLMGESHSSLRDDYEVSSDELDLMVEIAASTDGCHGARMTGGGFGGCAVALVADETVGHFVEVVSRTYQQQSGIAPALHVAHGAQGASIEG